MRIDSHQHYWLTSRTDYGWLRPELGRIYADYMPAQLKPHLARHGINRTVLVQAAPTWEESEFMLGIAAADETVAGVVGWLDLTADDFLAKWGERRRRYPKLVGLRPMIQDLPSDWLLAPAVVRHLAALADAGFPVDLQANPRHLPYIVELLRQVPNLRAVVNHLAKPAMTGELEPWRSHMEEIAAYPNVMAKLSGMVPEQLDAPWSADVIAPYARAVIETFGRGRVMFGSDWPVCLFSATYDDVVALLESCTLDGWSDEEKAALYGGNAAAFYKLEG
ncbi:amidohydrolase family protein [Paenibacillus cymbidii]|uniref:amidohydrolase family protein n=1 Tax=Paenibacillus cymbidii TaxID=1639034 RepID=UPI0010807D5D|nr:amidohydrolase family protein [Paenibacillus cymbidii]